MHKIATYGVMVAHIMANGNNQVPLDMIHATMVPFVSITWDRCILGMYNAMMSYSLLQNVGVVH
jgi:hypothetical protein